MSTPPKNTQIRSFRNFGLFGLKVSHNVRIEQLKYQGLPSKQLKSQSWPNVTWTYLQRSTLKTIEKSICPQIPQLSYDCTCCLKYHMNFDMYCAQNIFYHIVRHKKAVFLLKLMSFKEKIPKA